MYLQLLFQVKKKQNATILPMQTLSKTNNGVLFGFPLTPSIWLTGDSGRWCQTKQDAVICTKPLRHVVKAVDWVELFPPPGVYLFGSGTLPGRRLSVDRPWKPHRSFSLFSQTVRCGLRAAAAVWRVYIGNPVYVCIERSGARVALTLNILSLSCRPCSASCWLEVSFSTRFRHCCSFSWDTHTQEPQIHTIKGEHQCSRQDHCVLFLWIITTCNILSSVFAGFCFTETHKFLLSGLSDELPN